MTYWPYIKSDKVKSCIENLFFNSLTNVYGNNSDSFRLIGLLVLLITNSLYWVFTQFFKNAKLSKLLSSVWSSYIVVLLFDFWLWFALMELHKGVVFVSHPKFIGIVLEDVLWFVVATSKELVSVCKIVWDPSDSCRFKCNCISLDFHDWFWVKLRGLFKIHCKNLIRSVD